MEPFNLLVSCSWGAHGRAKAEILKVLKALGDPAPVVTRTVARGVLGVRTRLESRRVIKELQAWYERDPLFLQDTCKWVPVDLWTEADVDRMREAVAGLRDRIGEGETWRMTVEKRRYTRHHTSEIIGALAALIERKVDLTNPDKILRIDILGNEAGMSVLRREEIFSVMKPRPRRWCAPELTAPESDRKGTEPAAPT
jgi:tRNA acetyltransferase TAN1